MAEGSVTPIAGVNVNEPTAEALYGLKTNILADDGNQYVYGQASEAVTGTCTYTNATGVITDAVGSHTAPVAITANYYAWVRLTTGIHG